MFVKHIKINEVLIDDKNEMIEVKSHLIYNKNNILFPFMIQTNIKQNIPNFEIEYHKYVLPDFSFEPFLIGMELKFTLIYGRFHNTMNGNEILYTRPRKYVIKGPRIIKIENILDKKNMKQILGSFENNGSKEHYINLLLDKDVLEEAGLDIKEGYILVNSSLLKNVNSTGSSQLYLLKATIINGKGERKIIKKPYKDLSIV